MEPRFKTPLFKRCSRTLFRIIKLLSPVFSIVVFKKKFPANNLAPVLWDNFLAALFSKEINQHYGKQLEQLPEFKNKDTNKIFVLGCGQSVNSITAEQWNIVSKHLGIGVNYFFVNQHYSANINVVELGASSNAVKLFNDYCLDKNEQQINLLQIRHVVNAGQQFRNLNNLYYFSPKTLPTNDKEMLTAFHLKYAKSTRLINMHHASCLDAAITLAAQYNPKQIILIGVDLDGLDYFWEGGKTHAERDARDTVREDLKNLPFDKDKEKLHPSMNKKYAHDRNILPLDQYLNILKNAYLKEKGIELLIANPNSKLCDRINIKTYDFDEQR